MACDFDHRTRSICIVITAALLVLRCSAVHAGEVPQQASEYTVAGSVRDWLGSPMPGVSVQIEKSDASNFQATTTDGTGKFVLLAPSGGTYTLRIEKPGFREVVESVTIPRKVRGPFDVVLARSESQPAREKSFGAVQFSDSPDFTIAGVTDWTAAGGHGSDVTLRTSEAFARETHGLGIETSREIAPSTVPGESENNLRAAITRSPESFDANRRLGEFYFRSQRYDQAIPLLEIAYRIQPQDFVNAYNLVLAYKSSGELAQARDQLRKILANTDRADLHRQLGDVDEQMNDSLAAVHEYERATQLDPNEQNYFAWAAELLLHRAIQPAVEVFTKGGHAYPTSERMLAGLGAALYASGLYAQAADRFCAASDLNPADATPYLFLGKMTQASPQALPCAEERLARFSRDQPENALASYYYAIAVWKEAGDSDKATVAGLVESLLRKSIKIKPKFPEAYLQLGIVYADRGELGKAVTADQNAIAANPNLAEPHFRLGQAYRKTGEPLKAAQELKAYQRIQKTEALAVEQRRREIQQFVVVFKDQPQMSPTRK
jgi:tetratricopeptide (TPR) repeat protein